MTFIDTVKKIVVTLLFAFILIISYAYAISIIEHVDFFTALYFSVITITTTGYGDFTPKTFLGRTITILYLFIGVGIIMYLFSLIAEFIVEGQFSELIRMKKMEDRLKNLKDHYIICGYGKMGKVIGKKFLEEGIKFVAVDMNECLLKEEFEKYPDKFLYVVGDAKKEDILKKAQIEKAKCLLATLPTDSDNVFLVLTARELNPSIMIIAKANEKETIKKLKIAGANKVVSPYLLGGLRMALISTKTSILDFLRSFLNIAKNEYGEDIVVEKFKIKENSIMANKTIKNLDIRRRSGVTIIGVKRNDKMFINPYPEFVLKPGDIIYVLGTKDTVEIFRKYFIDFD